MTKTMSVQELINKRLFLDDLRRSIAENGYGHLVQGLPDSWLERATRKVAARMVDIVEFKWPNRATPVWRNKIIKVLQREFE